MNLICTECSREFPRRAATGMKPRFCSESCRDGRYVRRPRPRCSVDDCVGRAETRGLCPKHYSLQRKAEAGTCRVHKCSRPATRTGGTLCETHFYRVRRTGTTDDCERPSVYVHTGGYFLEFLPNHPLAQKGGMVVVHRRVLYEAIGPGEHDCHWCRSPVTWLAEGDAALIVDHLDDDKLNNAPDNLVPACNTCNVTRGMFQAWVRARAENDPDRLLEIVQQMLSGVEHGKAVVLGQLRDAGLLKGKPL